MANHHPASLTSVLAKCSHLHNGMFSLRQLGAIHRSLISSREKLDCSSIQNNPITSLEPILELQSPENQIVCQRILQDGNDMERLLVIQFLMAPLKCVDAMRCILLPYLLMRLVSEDFVIALLDLVEGVEEEHPQWSFVLETLQTTPSRPMATRILVCLFQKTIQPMPSLIQTFYETLWQTIADAISIPLHEFRNHPLIPCLSKEFLPVLCQTDGDGPLLWSDWHRPHTTHLWTRLMALAADNLSASSSTHQQQVLLVLTTVMCPLLPHLVGYELPDSETTEAARPFDQQILWQILYTCLSQGKSLWEEHSEASILRKRALYLLNTLATTQIWKKYVMCVEVLEMESEVHIVDQIWETVQELVEQVEEEPTQTYGVLTWDWMSLLYSRALSTYQPVVRKLGLYRLLRVDVGGKEASQKKQKGKKQTRNIQVKASNIFLLETMNPDFILNILLPSWNSLVTSVGYNMNLDKNGKVETEDMVPLFTTFLQSHLERMDSNDAEVFWKKLSSWSLVEKLHIKTIMLVFRSLSQKLFPTKMNIPADEETLLSFVTTYGNLFQIGSVVLSFRRELLQILAMMLSLCILPAGSTKKWSPMTVLKLLSLYSDHYLSLESENWNIDGEKMLVGLQDWISHQGHDSKVVGATMATAFVGGELNPTDGVWDATVGVTNIERKLAWSISLLCAFAANGHQQSTAGELLWPAIHKGLSNTAGAILSNTHGNADQVGRALILLENGCKLRLLSGLGNGDLVVDRNTQQLMPPPPNIEKMLSSSVDFILFHIQKLVSIETRGEAIGGTRQNWAKRTSTTFARLIAQIRTLHQSYPSSEAVSSAMDELLKSSVKDLSEGAENDSKRVALVALIYAAVSAGANPGADSHISFCQLLLKTELTGDLRKVSKAWEQTARSVLQYAKWAVISCIFPLLLSTLEGAPDSKRKEAQRLAADILVEAFDAVEATPADALLPLFHCIIATGKQWVSFGKEDNKMGEQVYLKNLTMIIKALLAVLKDSTKSRQSSLMLNEICALIFQPKLLYEEYKRLEDDPDCYTPIRDAFRKLIGTAGTQRPHITRSVLCRIAVGWLGDDESNTGMLGLNAIPYRDDIVQLLVHKESKVEESASNQNKGAISGGAQIPPETDELSMTRAFVLVFLSKLPDPSNGLNAKVLKELLHYVILQLFDKTAPKTSSNSPKLVMKGTASYCVKMRAWQALCNLSRFVTSDLADQVCDSAFNSMPESIHNQIRFFIENFSIKCATMHPEVFGPRFIKDISQRDLSLQHIASLMILGGNWVVGKYKLAFFTSGDGFILRKVLASVIPWLSSTQGFSRAIAQILVHSLIPLVLDVEENNGSLTDSDWFLRLIFLFLNENREMKRLRVKQMKFFDTYNVEKMCTPEGVLSISVDEGDEADPVHLVDAMKESLQEVYAEAHESDKPDWKQVEEMLKDVGPDIASDDPDDLVNFQRKIIPLDALNLAMENLRQKRINNAAGHRKHQLIVCASLIDKVPNLGGLARTAEIFSADRLVIPDIMVSKMDNFKSLSVGAGDWIDIEEVKEENLLSWLLEQKAKGYYVFGLEQTSSSVSLSDMVFPDRPTVLLLGKEKEGIPVEFLQAVDQCVEIPQLGIIRSLNVHVSGAIAIWEYTKQRRLAKSS